MATITRENIGTLNDKLTINLGKDDYLPSFEKSLRTYAKNANIPGFRKGMVPTGLIKKMYGNSLFVDENTATSVWRSCVYKIPCIPVRVMGSVAEWVSPWLLNEEDVAHLGALMHQQRPHDFVFRSICI